MLDFSKLPNPNPLTGGGGPAPDVEGPPTMPLGAPPTAAGARPLVDSASGATSVVFAAGGEERTRVVSKRFNERYTEYLTASAMALPRLATFRGKPIPGLPALLEAGVDRGQLVLLMRGIEGEALEQIAMRTSGLDAESARQLISTIATGLAALHAGGIMHLDVRPATVLWDRESREASLVDWGHCVPIVGLGEAPPGFPGPGFGSLPYTSMELLAGAAPQPSDDVFALACVAYEALGGTHPYGRRSAADAATFGLRPAPLPMLDANANDVLMRALALQRDQRTVTMADLAAAMRGTAPKASKAAAAQGAPRSRFFAGALVGLVAGAALAGAIAFALSGWLPATSERTAGPAGASTPPTWTSTPASAPTAAAPPATTSPSATPANPAPPPVAAAPNPTPQATQAAPSAPPTQPAPATPAPQASVPAVPATPTAPAAPTGVPAPTANANAPQSPGAGTTAARPSLPTMGANRRGGTPRDERERSDRATAERVPSEAYYAAIRACPTCSCPDLRMKRFALSQPLTWEEASYLINVCERGPG